MLATASAQVCVPLGHSSLYYSLCLLKFYEISGLLRDLLVFVFLLTVPMCFEEVSRQHRQQTKN